MRKGSVILMLALMSLVFFLSNGCHGPNLACWEPSLKQLAHDIKPEKNMAIYIYPINCEEYRKEMEESVRPKLRDYLVRDHNITVIAELEDLMTIYNRWKVEKSALFEDTVAQKIGKWKGADAVLLGNLHLADFSISLRLLDVQAGTVITSATAKLPLLLVNGADLNLHKEVSGCPEDSIPWQICVEGNHAVLLFNSLKGRDEYWLQSPVYIQAKAGNSYQIILITIDKEKVPNFVHTFKEGQSYRQVEIDNFFKTVFHAEYLFAFTVK